MRQSLLADFAREVRHIANKKSGKRRMEIRASLAGDSSERVSPQLCAAHQIGIRQKRDALTKWEQYVIALVQSQTKPPANVR
jgi:hypothetical protein